MNSKILLATLCGGILMFLLGWLIFGILLMDFYTANTIQYEGLMKEMPNLLLLFISNLLSAFLLSFIFQRWAGIKTFIGGLNGGLIIGLLLGLIYDLYFLASMNLYPVSLMVVDVIANAIMVGLVGGFIGWFLGTGKKKEAV
jgi:hypothetical protein